MDETNSNLIQKDPFYITKLDEERALEKDLIFSVKLNEDEQDLLKKCKKLMRQSKNSTALKDLAKIGAKVLLDEKTSFIIDTLFINKQKNKRNRSVF